MEIKRTVLALYGGPRESMGSRSGGNAWSHGRGVIGSPAGGVVVPNLIGLDYVQAANSLYEVSLTTGTVLPTIQGATPQNAAKVFYQNPSAGATVAEGTAVSYSFYEYQAPPPVFGPTDNWAIDNIGNGTSIAFLSSSYPDQEPEWAEIIAAPSDFKVVIAGGDLDGEYPIVDAGAFGPTSPGMTLMTVYPSPPGFNRPGYDIPPGYKGFGTAPGMSMWNGTQIPGSASIVRH